MATSYSDLIKIRGSRSTYNIQDEEGESWTDFIANDQFNGILTKVIKSVRNNDIDLHKSFWISGTYGTGKSHAAAVIKHLLCDPLEQIKEYVDTEFADAKYETLHHSIFELRKEKRLFPVMLYGQMSISHKEDLSLQLQRVISEALRKSNIDITVKTDFDNYVEHIKADNEFWEMLISKNPHLASVAPNCQKLVAALESNDISTLDKVREALREGRYDIRLTNNNLKQWFFEVQNKLAAEKTTYGYDGLLVIWDEFTDVMKSDIGLSLLVTLQEIDEMVMNSENNSYFFYISHPSAFNPLREDEREKTKGRYHFMSYNMEPVSAFKIMSRKFIVEREKQEEYTQIVNHFYFNRRSLLDIHSVKSTQKEETKEDIKKLFPLHPGTANLATYYAREVGAESRSVFQFIGDNDAVRAFLDSEDYFTGQDTISADYLWDYVIGEFNENVQKYGAVTERFNSRKLQVEAAGEAHFAVFKSILLLNALNNVANDETVTPSVENIKNLYLGTRYEDQLDEILEYLDANSIIQRLPGDLFSIQFSALPTKEIEEIKQQLMLTEFKYTSQVVNFGETARTEVEKLLKNVARVNQFMLYSENNNEYTLLNQIENGYKTSKPYEVFLAFLFARNNTELNTLKEIAEKNSREDRFKNVVFVMFDTPMGEKNYERFIEYMANAQCAQRHNLPDQQKAHKDSACGIIKDWLTAIRRGNFIYYLRGELDSNATIKITTTINNCVAPIIFEHGPESLDIIQTRFSKTYWAKISAKQMVDNILSFNTKEEISSRCNGQQIHVAYLLQDSVDENLNWKEDVDKLHHPLYLVSQFIDDRFKSTNKNEPFNLGDKLMDLMRPPYGLYPSYAGMGMVAFAMKKYVNQIFDLNGKPRNTQHIAEDIVEMFKAWEKGSSSAKQNFRFETKESRKVCDYFIKYFKLKEFKQYNDISSLTDARWAITHEFAKQKGFPLWSLKYITDKEGIKLLIDNILQICGDSDMRNPDLLNSTLNGFDTYTFELPDLLNFDEPFRTGFINFLKSVESVNFKEENFDEAKTYIEQHLEGEVGLWKEEEVSVKLKDWKLWKNEEEAKHRAEKEVTRLNTSIGYLNNVEEIKNYLSHPDDRVVSAAKNRIAVLTVTKPLSPVPGSTPQFSQKRTNAINKVRTISDVNKAKDILEKICENEQVNEIIIDLINNYDV